MGEDFHNRHDWFTLGAAMLVWFLHFNLLWAASSTFPDEPAARWIALALTIVAALALAWLWQRAGRPGIASAAGLGLAIASVGVGYDFVPAIIG